MVEMGRTWQLADFAKELDVPRNTVNGWFVNLEQNHIHFVNRNENDEKVYDELDLEIGEFIKLKTRETKPKWNFAAVHNELPKQFELRTSIVRAEKTNGLMSIDELKNEILTAAREVATTQTQNQQALLQNFLKSLTDREEENHRKIADVMNLQLHHVDKNHEQLVKQLTEQKQEAEEKQKILMEKLEKQQQMNKELNERFQQKLTEELEKQQQITNAMSERYQQKLTEELEKQQKNSEEKQNALRAMLDKQEELIKAKDDELQKLFKKLDELFEENQKIREDNQAYKEKLDVAVHFIQNEKQETKSFWKKIFG